MGKTEVRNLRLQAQSASILAPKRLSEGRVNLDWEERPPIAEKGVYEALGRLTLRPVVTLSFLVHDISHLGGLAPEDVPAAHQPRSDFVAYRHEQIVLYFVATCN